MLDEKYLDTTLSFMERAVDLVSRLTMEEKVSQLLYNAPAVERLRIEAYNWWGEGLHGVSRAGVATVFPQAIAMASSFDVNLLKEVATVISDEGRAKHHEFVRRGDRGIFKGLTFWSPNINIFRDPRWGRGHETYGEDPYLTGELGVAYIKGLQGDHPKYLKLAACAKHFAVHSGPESLRHSFNAQVSQKDLWETYLPAFEKAVKVGQVESVMGAYNRTNGEPCCGSKTLLQDILRDTWNFEGHVVSDCGGISDFHLHHKVTNTAEESATMAIKNGSDLNCGHIYQSLLSAIDQGLLEEKHIDVACSRLFVTRMKLGMFDPVEDVPYVHIPYEINDHPKHHALAIDAARRSMVLLKNEDNALPLKMDGLKNIAVIGPNADARKMLLGNYNGTPSKTVTPLRAIQEISEGQARVFYAKGCELVDDKTEPLAASHDRIAEAVSAAMQSDVAIVCVGLSAEYEGEAGDAHNSDASGDKIDIELPGLQNELIEAVIGTGVKTIIINFTGSAMNLSLAHDNAKAMIQAWYPGPEGGTALAELLFGRTDFCARMPVTWVKSVEDLPDFIDYSMKNRTYRYIETEPLYPFGYGLSYNDYGYSDFVLDKTEVLIGENLKLSVKVKNLSIRPGREIVQVYLKDHEASVLVPHYSLVAFDSIYLEAGEQKTIAFYIESQQMAVVDDAGKRVLEKGKFTVFVGGQGPDKRSAELTGKEVLQHSFVLV